MELRARSLENLHHMSTFKGGKFLKILNVTRGRPSLLFKEMKTIIGHEAYTKPIPLAYRPPYKEVDLNMMKSEEEIANDYCIDASKSSHESDVILGEMTLKQLKKKCRAKKQKDPGSLFKKIKQEYGGSNPEEDDLELEETLGSLKRKFSGKTKPRKRLKCGHQTETTDVVKHEPVSIDEKSLPVGGITMCATIKVEVSEPECSLVQEVAYPEDFVSSEHEMISNGKVVGEMQVTGENCTKVKDSFFIIEEPISFNADQVSCEHNTTAQSLQEIPVCEEMAKVEDLGIIQKVTNKLSDTVGCLSSNESSLIAEEEKLCSLNQSCYELDDHSGGSCLLPESSSHEVALKVNGPVMAVEQPMFIVAQEDKAIADALTCNESPDILFPSSNESNSDDDCTAYSPENKSQMQSSLSPVPDDQSLYVSERNHMHPVESIITSAKSQISVLDATRLELDSTVDTKVSGSVASDKTECLKLQSSPERLLSARKTISPDSQQKLCRAMDALDLPDYQKPEECKHTVSFEKQELNADRNSNIVKDQVLTSSTGPKHPITVDASPNFEQKMKAKNDRKRLRAKGANKIPSPAWFHLSSACGCIRSCSQNIIDFSQQQMTDIDRLALNITKELRSMKELMIEMLQPQVRRASTVRYNMNEVRVAVENATKVEDMTRRCLTTMTRDCNRFCKILSLAEESAVVSAGNSPAKEEAENDAGSVENKPDEEEQAGNPARKKIKFADENGGNLCNVRIIEDQESETPDSPTDNGQHSA